MNYFAPILPSALFASLKSRDYLVALGICGPLLLQGAITSSTGLFGLQIQGLPANETALLINEFNFSKWGVDIEYPASNPATSTWALEKYNITYPTGTTSEYAFQIFNIGNQSKQLNAHLVLEHYGCLTA